MNIAVVSSSPVPAVVGGTDRFLEGLCSALGERHPTDLITIPCEESTHEGIVRAYYDFFHLDLARYDLVISCRAPAYMARHPNHVVYLLHRMRAFYDLNEPLNAEHKRLKELVRWMDDWALDAHRIPYLFTIGETVSRRLRQFGGHASVALHPATTLKPAVARPGEYFLSVGRLHPLKRVDLIIRAFRRTTLPCKLVIAGAGPHEDTLHDLAANDSRIEFAGRVSDEELAELYAGALATVFPPVNEDMGYITFESFHAGKPVLTTHDSGEPALVVKDGRTGFITEPSSKAIAAKLEEMWSGRDKLEAMAQACHDRAKHVTWGKVVDCLLRAGERQMSRRGDSGRPAQASSPARSASAGRTGPNGKRPPEIRLLVTDNQIIDPPLGGGRVRILELYRHLPPDFSTTYVGMFDYPGPAYRDQQLSENFREILTPMTQAHFKVHDVLARLTAREATVDVTMALLGRLTPRYGRLIEQHLESADLLICAHPWMYPFFPKNVSQPLIYDSQNCESVVKTPLLKKTLAGRYLARRVKATEARVSRASRLILACSSEDAAAFGEIYATPAEKILVTPNGVDCLKIQPADESEKAEARSKLRIDSAIFAVFTASPYIPNLEGAEFIMTELAPAFPNVRFGIAGGVGPMYEQTYPDRTLPPNVTLFGYVKLGELHDIYRAADVALNPMMQGSGTNIKMLDYMAAGLPILTTPKGARGLEGQSGEHWVECPLESTAAEFRAMIDGGERLKAFGTRGRQLAESRYDWAGIAERLAERLRPLASADRLARNQE